METRAFRRWAAVLAILPAFACVETPIQNDVARSVELVQPVSGPGYVGVLFVPLDSRGRSLLGWVPDRSDVARVEAQLPERLAAAPPASFPDVSTHLVAYRRQYLGQLQDGRRVLQVNFIEEQLIDERKLDWESRRVMVPDVGRRFFQLWYDLDADMVSRFQISSASRGVRAPRAQPQRTS